MNPPIPLPIETTLYAETLALDERLRLNPNARPYNPAPPADPAPTWHLPLLEREPDLDWLCVPMHAPTRPGDRATEIAWSLAGCWAAIEPEVERWPLSQEPLVWGWRLAGWRLHATGISATGTQVQLRHSVFESPMEAMEAGLAAMRRHAAELVAAANPPAPSPEAGLPLFGGSR